jgi:hypothetical protein
MPTVVSSMGMAAAFGPSPDIALQQRALVLPAPPRFHERRAIWKDDRGCDVPGSLSVRLVTTYAFGPMARHNARFDVVDRDHVGAAIAGH